MPEDQRASIHKRIGSTLKELSYPSRLNEEIFEIIEHYNYGSQVLRNPIERIEVAYLNVLAGRIANARTAFENSIKYLKKAISLFTLGRLVQPLRFNPSNLFRTSRSGTPINQL